MSPATARLGLSYEEAGRLGGATAATRMTRAERKARARLAAAKRWKGHKPKRKRRSKVAPLSERRTWFPNSIGFEVDVKDLHLLTQSFDAVSEMITVPTPPRRTKSRPDDIYIPPSSRGVVERFLENKERYVTELEHERR